MGLNTLYLFANRSKNIVIIATMISGTYFNINYINKETKRQNKIIKNKMIRDYDIQLNTIEKQ